MRALTLAAAGLALLAGTGCGRNGNPPAQTRQPAPPPAAASAPSGGAAQPPPATPHGPPAVITVDSEMQRELDKRELAQRLRDYSAMAGTNSPFALSEQEIDSLTNQRNPVLN